MPVRVNYRALELVPQAEDMLLQHIHNYNNLIRAQGRPLIELLPTLEDIDVAITTAILHTRRNCLIYMNERLATDIANTHDISLNLLEVRLISAVNTHHFEELRGVGTPHNTVAFHQDDLAVDVEGFDVVGFRRDFFVGFPHIAMKFLFMVVLLVLERTQP